YVPPASFPQRLKKNMLDKEFLNFLDVFKKLHINIPFTYVVAQMPNYAWFIKDILSKKRKLEEYETVNLTECSAILQKNTSKVKISGEFYYTLYYRKILF
ncbi:hypothetical protein CFOL_v3_28134, partial [Cephalotus follicularis]